MNPFASKFTGPARCQYLLPAKALATETPIDGSNGNTDALLAQWQQQILIQPVSQIVGPHGCGKTSLAIHIARSMSSNFATLHCLTLHREKTNWFTKPKLRWMLEPPFTDACLNLNSQAEGAAMRRFLLVDGIETVSTIQARTMLKHFSSQRFNLLITTHQKLPAIKILTRLRSELAQFRDIVTKLTQDQDLQPTCSEVENAYHQAKGNYRQALWLLYNQWEAGRCGASDKATAANR